MRAPGRITVQVGPLGVRVVAEQDGRELVFGIGACEGTAAMLVFCDGLREVFGASAEQVENAKRLVRSVHPDN